MNQMETNQATLHIFKEETIEIEEHFFNIDVKVKQELDEDVHSVNVTNDLNGETNAISSIKQESNIDNIENKLNYSNGKQKITKLREPQSCVKKKLEISSDGGIRKREDDDVRGDFSDDDGTSQNEIKKIRKIQNKIRCKRYRDKKKSNAIFGSPIYKNQIVTVEEEEKIKRRKEYNKQKSKRYRDRKRAINLYKVVRNVSTYQKIHSSQIAGPSTRNEPYILKSHSDYDIASKVNHYKNNKNTDALVGSLIHKNRTITVGEAEKIKRRKEYNKQKCQRYRDRKRAANFINLQRDQPSKTVCQYKDFHNSQIAVPSTRNLPYIPTFNTAALSTRNEPFIPESHSDYEDDDIHNNLSQVKNGRQYRDITTDVIVGSDIYKNQTLTVEEDEEIKRRKEYNKQKSQRYRDRKRAAHLINLQRDQPTKTVVNHVSECQDFLNSQIADPSTRNVPYVPSIHNDELSTSNEPYISESHSDYDDDIHNDALSQVKHGSQYRDITTDAIVGSDIDKNRTITVEEDEEIKSRKEYNKQKSQRYRDRKRAANFLNLQSDQPSKTVVNHVSECQDFPNSQIADPSTRNLPYVPLIHTADLSIPNEPFIPESQSDYDDAIVGSEIYKNQTLTVEEDEEIKRKEYNKQKSQRYRDRKRAANFINLQTDQSSKTDIHNDALSQVKNVPQYRDKNNKTTDIIVGSQTYKNRTITIEEEEEIKRRKEYNKQKSQRYRDRKRAANLINLQTDQSSKTVVNHVSKCQDLQTAVSSTRNAPYVPPIHTADLSTPNQPYVPESHSDDDDTSSQVNYVSQLYEPIITIYVANTQNLLHDVQ